MTMQENDFTQDLENAVSNSDTKENLQGKCEDTISQEQACSAEEAVVLNQADTVPTGKKQKFTKKKTVLWGVLFIAVIAVAFAFLHESKFEKVKNECLHIAGQISSGKNYFTIDTDPDDWENMDATVKALLLPQQQKQALEAIRYANDALGFNGSVYSKMMGTSALMGRQSEETNKYKVSWTYHPDDGLEVTYEIKK